MASSVAARPGRGCDEGHGGRFVGPISPSYRPAHRLAPANRRPAQSASDDVACHPCPTAAPLLCRDHISVPTIPALARARCRLGRFLTSTVELMTVLARACGHQRLGDFTVDDLTTFDRELHHFAGVPYGGLSA